MLFGLSSISLPSAPQDSAQNNTPTIIDTVHKAAMAIFKILAAPVVISFYLLACPVQLIVSTVIGGLSSGKTAGKTYFFGLTFFSRSLASAVGLLTGIEPKGGAPYTPRSEVSKGLHVSRLPFQKDVEEISVELKKEKGTIKKADFINKITASKNISEDYKTKIKEALQSQQLEEIQGLVLDVTEHAETTYVLGLGRPATQEDWNKQGILYLNFPAEDMKALDVKLNLALAEVAQLARESKVGALIHCAKGIGRSLTIGLTTHALYGEGKDIQLAPSVDTAIKTIKQRRAYGLTPSQELVVYTSKVLRLLSYLEGEAKDVTAETIQSTRTALKNKQNLKDLANEMIGTSIDHRILKEALQQLQAAKQAESSKAEDFDALLQALGYPHR
jgi:hypothetical protein